MATDTRPARHDTSLPGAASTYFFQHGGSAESTVNTERAQFVAGASPVTRPFKGFAHARRCLRAHRALRTSSVLKK